MSRINETLKQKIDEWDLDRRLDEVVDQAEKGFHRVLETAGGLAHERRQDVDHVLDRLGAQIEERTGGKYAERLEQVRRQVDSGLDRLAERRPESPGETGPGSTPDTTD